MRKKLMLLSIVSAAASLTTSCANTSGVSSDICALQPDFTLDAGYEHRWTADEKRQALKLNENLDRICRR